MYLLIDKQELVGVTREGGTKTRSNYRFTNYLSTAFVLVLCLFIFVFISLRFFIFYLNGGSDDDNSNST